MSQMARAVLNGDVSFCQPNALDRQPVRLVGVFRRKIEVSFLAPLDPLSVLSQSSSSERSQPRILVVTPEITYLPDGMGNLAQRMHAKAGGLADVSASLVKALYDQGADVHVALPDYRKMFNLNSGNIMGNEYEKVRKDLPEQHIHLAEDRIFYYQSSVYNAGDNHKISLAFQREIINHIIGQVQPDLIHCNDWMTGLIPPVARRWGIPCLFTIHNIHTERITMAEIEDRGIDVADFWQHLFFEQYPQSYEYARENQPVDFLASGIFAADHVNAVSPRFLSEIVDGKHDFVPEHIVNELRAKCHAGCASGILNAPDDSYDPALDEYLDHHFTPRTHREGKAKNKALLQQALGLEENPDAPVFFWPSRLDPVQKGCQLLSDILYDVVHDYWDSGIQFAIIANGEHQHAFHDIVDHHDIRKRVAVVDFKEELSRLGYAGSDFMVMPSTFEPCGLPQMVSPKYGTIPVVHDTGGIHDTVDHLNPGEDTGNGYLFNMPTTEGLRWGIGEAMYFFQRDPAEKEQQIARIMKEATDRFNHETTAAAYISRYEKMLGRKVTA